MVSTPHRARRALVRGPSCYEKKVLLFGEFIIRLRATRYGGQAGPVELEKLAVAALRGQGRTGGGRVCYGERSRGRRSSDRSFRMIRTALRASSRVADSPG